MRFVAITLLLAICLVQSPGQAQTPTKPATTAAPTHRALLVGVSEYPHLRKDLHLEGPRNDVIRMREALVARRVATENITVLADGVPGAELPTRERILGELDRLARTAKAGDYIVILMAGHGSQQPVPAGSPFAAEEPDGMFEVFLPRDVEGWGNRASGTEGDIKGAILDHEVRARVDRMTSAGAFVWAIFDSCHSASLVRGASDVKMRQVTPDELGVPKEVVDRAVARAAAARDRLAASGGSPVRNRSVGPNEGGSVFFYAAQTTEPTPEMRLPAGAPDRRSHGLFSYTILQALEGGAGMTYQQLAQQVLTRYAGMSEARATPLFSGTAMHTGLLGQATTGVQQWRVQAAGERWGIAAGALAGVEEGAVFAILPSAIASLDAVIGYAEVGRADATFATLQPVAFGGVDAKPLSALRSGQVARLVRPSFKFDFVVGVDLESCEKPCAFEGPLAQLRSAGSAGVPGAKMSWVGGKDSANIRLIADGRRLWLAPPSLAAGRPCVAVSADKREACRKEMEQYVKYVDVASTTKPETVVQFLRTALHSASRATNLMRVATGLGTGVSADLKVTVTHIPAGRSAAPVTPSGVSRLKPGDKVQVQLENTGQRPIDVTVLYIDSGFGIEIWYPESGALNRLEPGAKMRPLDVDITASSFGLERLAIIAVEGRKGEESANYAFLAQPSLSSETLTRGAEGKTRDATLGEQLFRDAGFAEFATRGAKPAPSPQNAGMQIYSWQVVPQ